MRIIFITRRSFDVLECLFQANFDIVGIVESGPRKRQSKFGRFLINSLVSLYGIVKPDIKNLMKYAKSKDIPYYYLEKDDTATSEIWMKEQKPDLIVVSSMSHLLPENIIGLPKYGIINLHTSYLPEYKGPNPTFWTYYDYILNPGVTVHYIDKGEDTGDIICQDRFRIDIGEPLASFRKKARELGCRLLIKAINEIHSGSTTRIKQPSNKTFFRARNIEPVEYPNIINWNEWDVQRVWHFLRGTSTYAMQLLDCNNLTRISHSIEVGHFVRCETPSNMPLGKIIFDGNDSYIPCKDGRVFVKVKFDLASLVINILKP